MFPKFIFSLNHVSASLHPEYAFMHSSLIEIEHFNIYVNLGRAL